MAIKLRATLKAEKRADGTQSIRIRVTGFQEVTYYNTGITINPKHWNKAAKLENRNWVTSKSTDNGKYNARIRQFMDELDDLAHEYPELSPPELVDLYKRKREGREAKEGTAQESLVSYIERELALIKPTIEFRTFNRYLRHTKRIKAFCGDLPISGMTLTLLKKMDSYLLEKNERSTVNKELQFLNMMLTRATAEGILEYRDNPFHSYTWVTPKKTHKEKLLDSEIALLENLEMEPGTHGWHTRNCFMIQYLLAGARIGDVLILKWSGISEDRVVYFPLKGRRFGKRMSILLTDRLRKYLDLYRGEEKTVYVLPHMAEYAHMENKPEHEVVFFKTLEARTSSINRKLKQIALLAGITKSISSHVARHSFADKLRRGGDLYAASKLLGHSTLKQTETYFKELDEEAEDGAMRGALGE